MHFHIITLFPESFNSYLSESIIARAIEEKSIMVSFYNPRDYTTDKHRQVDDKSYGGGPGMVMQVEPILRAAEDAIGKKEHVPVYIMSPRGEQFSNVFAEKLAEEGISDVLFISGRYEGIDARVKEILNATEVSVGPYTLTGGELPAMIMIDTIARRLPGVLGSDASVEERRIAGGDVYTRPEVIEHNGKEYKVPEVLVSGNHAEIDKFREGEN